MPKTLEASSNEFPIPKGVRFSLLVDNLECAFCHTEIHGDVASVGDVGTLRSNATGKVFGKWLVSGDFHARDLLKDGAGTLTPDALKITGELKTKYDNAGKELPVDSSGKPVFPALDFAKVSGITRGTLASASTGVKITKAVSGSTLLIGTKDNPIAINRDIYVDGDVIIKGYYTGIGTIYASGNIYIPANLVAVNPPAFPYSDDPAKADADAKVDVTSHKDAIALAAKGSIFIADLENYRQATAKVRNLQPGEGPPQTYGTGLNGQTRYISIYVDDPIVPPRFRYDTLGVRNIYKFAKSETQYQALYEKYTPCVPESVVADLVVHSYAEDAGQNAFTRIDAFLYAMNAIAGVARDVRYDINGGIIAKDLHIISGGGYAPHCSPSRLNYDYRARNGLPILEALGEFFPD